MSKCQFCGSAAVSGHCTWPVTAFIETPVRDLQAGQICRNLNGTRRGKVLAIERHPPCPGGNYFDVTVQRLYSGNPAKENRHIDTYLWHATAAVQATRERECGAAACVEHIRDLDGGFVCVDHWGEQLAAIAS